MAKPLLSSDSILDGALALLASEGAENLSVRKLAAHLRCSPNTLYQQVGSRDELIRQLLVRQLESLDQDFKAGPNWQSTAYDWCVELRRSLLVNPQLTRLMTVSHRELVLKDVNALLKTLLSQGLDKPVAVLACKVLTHVVFGLCFTELQTPDDYRQKQSTAENSGATLGAPDIFAQAVRWTINGIEAGSQ